MSPDAIKRYAELDPADSPDVIPDWESVAPVLLEAIDGRMVPMQLRDKTEPTRRRDIRSTRYSRAMIGVFAFVLILAVATVGLLLSGDDSDFAGDSEQIEMVEAFAADLNEGAIGSGDYLNENATFIGVFELAIDDDLAGYWATLETGLDLESCERSGQALVECTASRTDAIHGAMNAPLSGTWLFLFEDDRITQILERIDDGSLLDGRAFPIEDYIAWLNSRHPEYLDQVEFVHPERRNERFDTSVRPALLPETFLVLNAHNAEVLMRYVDEYETELDSTGGLPEDWSEDRWSSS